MNQNTNINGGEWGEFPLTAWFYYFQLPGKKEFFLLTLTSHKHYM